MSEKIFGEIQITDELNELANNLRKNKEFDEIRLLCSENNIPAEKAEEFINGNLFALCEAGYLEKDMTTLETERIRSGLLISSKQEPKKQAHTVDEVKKKLEAELEIYRDGDSKYVIERLTELCSTDIELRNAIMLPHKSYNKAFQYFYQKSRTVGYQMPHGNMVYLDNDIAVKLSVEYFKSDDKTEVENKPEKRDPLVQKKTNRNTQKSKTENTKPKADEKQAVNEYDNTNQIPRNSKNKNEIIGQLSLFDSI